MFLIKKKLKMDIHKFGDRNDDVGSALPKVANQKQSSHIDILRHLKKILEEK